MSLLMCTSCRGERALFKLKYCDFDLVLVCVVILTILTTPIYCAKLDTKLKMLINEDELLTIQQPKPISQETEYKQNIKATADAAKHEHYNLYHSELKRLSYETIHRILRDENEPNYRKEDSELRYYQKRSLHSTAHTLVRRAADEQPKNNTAMSTLLTHTAENLTIFIPPKNCAQFNKLNLDFNQLQTLNLSGCHNLQQLELSNNALVELPLALNMTNSTLLELNLNDNQIKSAKTPALSHLRALHLSANHIENLAALNLSLLTALEALDLSCNRISNLETAFFPERMHNLKHLNLANNRLSSIYRATFYNLLSLNTLILSNNNISEIDYETFLALPNLQYLDLSHNQLQADSIRALQGIPDLVSLSIAYNPDVGASMQEFVASWSLKELDASGTGLCQIPAALAQSVRTLKLTHNWLKVINCGDLDSYPLLQYLDLSNSHIEDIEDDALGRLEILQTLFLDHNKLRKIPVSLPTTLENLFLHNNEIMDIQVVAFQGLNSLQTLDLSGNRLLLYLPALPLPKLLTLNLQAAGITGISQAIVHTLPRLRDLLLEDNPIKCSDLLGIAEWASPCRERVVSSTSADSNADDGNEKQHTTNMGQQQENDEWASLTIPTSAALNTKIDLKQNFLQEHNFFENFKSNCGKAKQMLTEITQAEKQPSSCASEFFEQTTLPTNFKPNKEAKILKSKVISQFVLSGDRTKVQKKYATAGTNKTQATMATITLTTKATSRQPTNKFSTDGSDGDSVSEMPVQATKTLLKILKSTIITTSSTKQQQKTMTPAVPRSFVTATTTKTASPFAASSLTNEANSNQKIPTTTAGKTISEFGITTTQLAPFTATKPSTTTATAYTITSTINSEINKLKLQQKHEHEEQQHQPIAALNKNVKKIEQKNGFTTKMTSPNAAIDMPHTIFTNPASNNNKNKSNYKYNSNSNSNTHTNTDNNSKAKSKQVSVMLMQNGMSQHSPTENHMHTSNTIQDSSSSSNFNVISGQQQNIVMPTVTKDNADEDTVDNAKHILAKKVQRPEVLPTTTTILTSTITTTPTTTTAQYQQHKHEPMQLHIKDRHLIGTPLLMHKGENILVELEQLRPLPTTNKATTKSPASKAALIESIAAAHHTDSLAQSQQHLTTAVDVAQLKVNEQHDIQLQQQQQHIVDKPHTVDLLDKAKTEIPDVPKNSKRHEDKKKPSLTMKKMTIMTKHAPPLPANAAAAAAAANENEAVARSSLLMRLNFKELKPDHSITTKHHNTVNTAITDNQHELSTFAELQQQQQAESLIKFTTDPATAIASQTKTEQWLDRRKAQTTGHPGIVLLLSLSLFIVLLVGLMHVYRCDMPWRRHLPQQRPHHQRQLQNDDDAHSFLSYQKWHHSTRLEQPYNSPLHSLHVRELQKSTNLADKNKRCQQLQNAKFPTATSSSSTNSSSNGSSTTNSSNSSHSSGLNNTLATAHAVNDNDAYYIEMPTATAHVQNNLHSDLLPMELLSMSSSHTRCVRNADDLISGIQTTPVNNHHDGEASQTAITTAKLLNFDVAAFSSAAAAAADTTTTSNTLAVKLTPSTRMLSIW